MLKSQAVLSHSVLIGGVDVAHVDYEKNDIRYFGVKHRSITVHIFESQALFSHSSHAQESSLVELKCAHRRRRRRSRRLPEETYRLFESQALSARLSHLYIGCPRVKHYSVTVGQLSAVGVDEDLFVHRKTFIVSLKSRNVGRGFPLTCWLSESQALFVHSTHAQESSTVASQCAHRRRRRRSCRLPEETYRVFESQAFIETKCLQ